MMMLTKRIGAGAMLVLAAVLASAQTYPSHQITNGEITATVYLPDAKNGFYKTTRFDWSGAIGSLKYKGHDYYGTWWSKITDIYDFGYEGPNKDVISADFTAMVGPAEEFGALGYTDVPAGGLFVKPGVGVLRRDEAIALARMVGRCRAMPARLEESGLDPSSPATQQLVELAGSSSASRATFRSTSAAL